jgi:hypothetical protein
MVESEREPDIAAADVTPEHPEDLVYRIEIWNGLAHRAERVLARAASAHLARAIFQAACAEHPHAHLVLRLDARILKERPIEPLPAR